MAAQLLIAGIVNGAIYAMIGLGLTVGFKTTEVINFAYGMMVVVGAYIGVVATADFGLNYAAAFVLAVAGAMAVGWIADRLVYQRLLDAPHMIQVLATLAVASLLRGGVIAYWGTGARGFPNSARMAPVITSPVVITGQQLLIVVCSIGVTIGLTLFFALTRWGKALRATSQNRVGASLCGIRASKAFSVGNVMSAMLGGMAGVLFGPLTLVDPSLDWVLVKGFAVAAVGGLTSLPGTVVGGLVLGLSESLWAFWMPAMWAPVVSYVLITVILVAKPTGLFGGSAKQKL